MSEYLYVPVNVPWSFCAWILSSNSLRLFFCYFKDVCLNIDILSRILLFIFNQMLLFEEISLMPYSFHEVFKNRCFHYRKFSAVIARAITTVKYSSVKFQWIFNQQNRWFHIREVLSACTYVHRTACVRAHKNKPCQVLFQVLFWRTPSECLMWPRLKWQQSLNPLFVFRFCLECHLSCYQK